MELPKKLRLLGLNYSTQFEDGIKEVVDGKEAGYFGVADYAKQIIRLDKNQTVCHLVDTVLHEVCHVIYHEEGHDNDIGEQIAERVVQALSHGLFMVFSDNPDLLQWIAETLKED